MSNYDAKPFVCDAVISVCEVTMYRNNSKYFGGHLGWVNDNAHIVSHFFEMADQNRIKDVKVSQRFICEFLRWKSRKREIKGDFKISNDNVALMAHLYNDSGAAREGFFHVKGLPVIKLPKHYEDNSKITGVKS